MSARPCPGLVTISVEVAERSGGSPRLQAGHHNSSRKAEGLGVGDTATVTVELIDF
jgi:hypothetical protein